MELNYILEWLVGVISVAALIRLLRSQTYGRTGWIITFAAAIVLLLAGMLSFPETAGVVAGAFLGVFVLTPSFLLRFIHRSILQQNFARARKIAMIVTWLHPADGMLQYPGLLRSFELGRQGRVAEAEQLLIRYESYSGTVGRSAGLYLKRLRGDWEGMVQWCSTIPEASLIRSVDSLTIYLRALGEVGRLNDMMQAYDRFRKVLARHPKNLRDLARLYVYAFCGRTDLVKKLFTGSLKLYPPDIHEFWLGTSEIAAGRVEEGRRRFEALRTVSDALVQKGVQLRMSHPLAVATTELIPPSLKILETDALTYEQEERFEVATRAAGRPWMTLSLISACLIVFAGEIALGGATNPRTLWRMGAMMPSLVWQGEWWRILAAQFLHFGWVHLAMNMLALYLLGPFVEQELGRLRYLLLYVLSGTGAMLTIIFLTSHGMLRDDFVVGASGSILGLIGGSAALLLLGWIRHRAVAARRRLVSMLLIIALQMVFDLMTPQVSFTAHLGGAAFGFLIAGAMRFRFRGQNEVAAQNT